MTSILRHVTTVRHYWRKETYMTKRIQVVVGELQLLERNELAAPVSTGSGRVRVHIEPSGHSGLCLSRHRPAEPRKDGTLRDQCVTDQRARPNRCAARWFKVTEGSKKKTTTIAAPGSDRNWCPVLMVAVMVRAAWTFTSRANLLEGGSLTAL